MRTLPILTYHRITDGEPTKDCDPQRIAVSRRAFRAQLAWLKRLGMSTVPLNRYPEWLREGKSIPLRTFAITFDDGYDEVRRYALPLLREFGFTATIFAVSGQLGGRNAWDDGREPLMTIEGYRQWLAAGMSVGAHSARHPHLPQESDASARQEIRGCKDALEDALRTKIPLYAYPYGETDDRIDAIAREAGFTGAFATDRAPIDHAANPYRIRRAVIFPKNTSLDILMKAQPWYARYQDWKRR